MRAPRVGSPTGSVPDETTRVLSHDQSRDPDPGSSWESMEEGMFLAQNGISPYEGSLFHNQPLLLKFFIQLQNISAKFEVDFAFFFLLFCDILAGYSLFKCCETYLEQRQEEEKLLSQTEFDKDAYEVFNAGKRSVEHYAKIVDFSLLVKPVHNYFVCMQNYATCGVTFIC